MNYYCHDFDQISTLKLRIIKLNLNQNKYAESKEEIENKDVPKRGERVLVIVQ
jgi:uncharacterized protein YxeA